MMPFKNLSSTFFFLILSVISQTSYAEKIIINFEISEETKTFILDREKYTNIVNNNNHRFYDSHTHNQHHSASTPYSAFFPSIENIDSNSSSSNGDLQIRIEVIPDGYGFRLSYRENSVPISDLKELYTILSGQSNIGRSLDDSRKRKAVEQQTYENKRARLEGAEQTGNGKETLRGLLETKTIPTQKKIFDALDNGNAGTLYAYLFLLKNTKNKDFITKLLQRAASKLRDPRHNPKNIIKILMKFGADVNAQDSTTNGNTVAHTSLRHGNLFFLMALLNDSEDQNIDLTLKNHEGLTPLHIAVQNQNLGGVRMILRHLLNRQDYTNLLKILTSQNVEGNNVVHLASSQAGTSTLEESRGIFNELMQAIDTLHQQGSDFENLIESIDVANHLGDTPLHISLRDMRNHHAVRTQRQHYASELIKRGFNHEVQNRDGNSPLELSTQPFFLQVATALMLVIELANQVNIKG